VKRVKGIKTLSIGAIIANGVLSLLLFSAWVLPGAFTPRSEINLLLTMIFANVLGMLYPVQLLLIREKYYRHVPISLRAKFFLHAFRIVQLLFTMALSLLLLAAP